MHTYICILIFQCPIIIISHTLELRLWIFGQALITGVLMKLARFWTEGLVQSNRYTVMLLFVTKSVILELQ